MGFTITPDELKKSAIQYRKELLVMMSIGLANSLQHMTLRTGVQYKQKVGQYDPNAQFGPYDPTRKNTTLGIAGRELEVFLGSVIKDFDPNEVVQSIYGSLTLQGEGLKNTPIAKAVLAAEMKSLSAKLNQSIFKAVRNASGTTSMDLYNGFDTIADAEITAGNLATSKKNLFEFTEAIDKNNAVDALKAFYRASKDELKGEACKLYMPYEVLEAYEDDYQQTVGASPYNKGFEKKFLEGSNGLCEFVPMASKSGSKFLQLSTKGNMLVGTGAGNAMETLDVDRFSPFLVTLSAAILFGCQYETISAEKLNVGKLYQAPAVP